MAAGSESVRSPYHMKHSIVAYEKGKFGAWPANGGIWQWGNEILVSFQWGTYKHNDVSHCIDEDSEIYAAFARSMDGGLSFTLETLLSDIYKSPVKPVPEGGFDFSNPDFVMRITTPKVTILSRLYIVSYDRGHTWDGPYELPEFSYPLTARTCYHIEGKQSMRLFLSYKLPNEHKTVYTDRAFVAETHDGLQSVELVGEITNDLPRSVMPDVVRLNDGTLVAAMRRRLQYDKLPKSEETAHMLAGKLSPWSDDNWIEVRRSFDNGKTWTNPVRAADTAYEYNRNGNPPAMTLLEDGRLVLVYGFRGAVPAIKAKVSSDGGITWGDEIILRDDARNSDIGYPRIVTLGGTRCAAIYYYTTEAHPEQHIEATVFEV